MFTVPDLLRRRRRSELKHCWLAGTLSETMLKKTLRPNQLAKTDIVVSCDEILRVLSEECDEENQTAHCSLNLASNLMGGVVRLFANQVSKCEEDVVKAIEELCAADDDIRSKLPKKQKKEPIVELIAEDLPVQLTPSLDLNRPFGPDMNLLQLTPAINEQMNEIQESELLPVPSLTFNELEVWMRDETTLWPGTELQVPEWLKSDNPPLDELFDEAGPERLDLPTRVLSPMRFTRASKADSPAMQLRETLRSKIDEMIDLRGQEQPPVIPMELDETSILPPLEDPDVLAQPVALEVSMAPEAMEGFAAPVDSETLVAPVVPETFEAPVAPETSAAPPVSDASVAPVSPVAPNDIFDVRPHGSRKRRGKLVDAPPNLTPAVKNRWKSSDQAHCVPPESTKVQVRVSSGEWLPSRIFQFDTKYLHSDRMQGFAVDLLHRYAVNICYTLHLEDKFTASSPVNRARSPALPEPVDPSIGDMVRDREDIVEAIENGTADQFTEINVEQPVDVPQPDAFDEPALNKSSISPARILLADVEDAPPAENTSDANTVSIGQMRISSDPFVSSEATARPNFTDQGSENLDEFLPPARPAKTPQKEKQLGHSKSTSSGEVTEDIDSSDLSSQRSSNTPPSRWTKKDLLGCLEILWHNHDIVAFEELIPPESSTDVDATKAFMLILELYQEDKLNLTQPEPHGELYMEKIVQSVPKDWTA